MTLKIPVCRPSTTSTEIKWVNRALKDNQISSQSKYVKMFEKKLAEKVGTRYAISVNSGTSALFLALKALGIGEGDEVIVPDFTMISTPNAVAQCGAKPVFVDVDRIDGNIEPELIEKKITPRTKAIIPVHLYGFPCDMASIMEIARKYSLRVIEDCAEAHGAKYGKKVVGSIGDAGCFSFYANKIITVGEGGAVVCNDPKLAYEIEKLKSCYFFEDYHFWHRKIGWNMRMSSLEAAYGLGQLERWDELIQARIDNANYYRKHLKDYVEVPRQTKDAVYWMYLIKTPDRDELMEYLERKGIETRTGFYPCHLQPPYKENDGCEYPVSEELSRTSMYLPSASDLTKKEKDEVIRQIKNFFK